MKKPKIRIKTPPNEYGLRIGLIKSRFYLQRADVVNKNGDKIQKEEMIWNTLYSSRNLSAMKELYNLEIEIIKNKEKADESI